MTAYSLFARTVVVLGAAAFGGACSGSTEHDASSSGGSTAGSGGGTAGSGGSTAGSGGSTAGSGGSTAGSGGAGADGGAGFCSCVSTPLTWGENGGLVAYADTMSIDLCNVFTVQRDTFMNAAPLTCSTMLGGCGNAIGVSDVSLALESADVQAAIAAAPVLYGGDPRAVDGSVLRIVVGGAQIEVGTDCNGGAMCVPIPPGVATLAQLLNTLTQQESAKQPCRGVLGG